MNYKTLKQGKNIEISVNSGSTPICLDSPGQYTFTVNSCHEFDPETVTYDTSAEKNQVTINAQKHKTAVSIEAERNYGAIEVEVQIEDDIFKKTAQFENNQYEIQLLLRPVDVATLTPKSDKLVFTPEKAEVQGATDCVHQGNKFKAALGKVFEGRIEPPLNDVQITVENLQNNQVYSVKSDLKGNYKFPPLDNTFEYKITAEKESYFFIGPDQSGKFVAQKLAEVNVEVLDEDDRSPLLVSKNYHLLNHFVFEFFFCLPNLGSFTVFTGRLN